MTSRRVRYVAVVAGLLCLGALAALLASRFQGDVRPEDRILSAYRAGREYGALEIDYPFDETIFPPEMVAPTFSWKDEHAEADTWLVSVEFSDGQPPMNFLSGTTQWTPSPEQWETIKARSLERDAKVSIVGVTQSAPESILSAAGISISTSKDEVGAPLFYREVNLPFIEAVKDPSRIRWRFGTISSQKQPPVVLENLPVCGNCHSFSADGSVLGMDIDYANDKGSYAIAPVEKEISLTKDRIITWSDYKREDGEFTFGLLSQVSPDGKYVVSTVKDLSVFVPRPDLEFSQLFFPIKGILVFYDRATRTFHPLPGADDKEFVQSNPTWSPDGKYIVFARSKVHNLKSGGRGKRVLLTSEESREFLEEGKTFQFDLYRIPFNGGKGGKPEPLEGASENGMSNYFPRYSPNGKWIVFCRAKSFMLLQPDSELYIVPAQGGKVRRLRCNTSRMNSWHSWSPNSKWLVFSSKANGPYTQLWLTHIDQEGRSSPPVLLSHFTSADRAANIPEFVYVRPGAVERIRQQFVDEYSFVRAAREYLVAGDLEGAIRLCQKALKLDPRSAEAHDHLGDLLMRKGMIEEGKAHFAKAIECQPEYTAAYNNLGLALYNEGKLEEAIELYRKAVEIDPEEGNAHNNWGNALLILGEFDQAIEHYRKALEVDPRDVLVHSNLALSLSSLGKFDQAIEHYRKALEINPKHVPAYDGWGDALANLGKLDQAIAQYRKALEINPQSDSSLYNLGNALMKLGKLEQAIEHYSKALEINPKHAATHNNLGLALAQRGEFRQAIEHYSKALEIDPKHDAYHYNWANALASLREFDQAIEHYQKALQINPAHALAHDNLGVLLIQQGKVNQAIAHWEKATAIDPGDIHAHVFLGNALATQGEFQLAIAHLQKAIEINPNDLRASSRLARLLATCPKDSIRDGARAVELAERVCKATGHKIPELLDTLAAAYAEAGRFPEAVATAAKAEGLAEPRQKPLAETIRRRLELYKAGKPYREQP